MNEYGVQLCLTQNSENYFQIAEIYFDHGFGKGTLSRGAPTFELRNKHSTAINTTSSSIFATPERFPSQVHSENNDSIMNEDAPRPMEKFQFTFEETFFLCKSESLIVYESQNTCMCYNENQINKELSENEKVKSKLDLVDIWQRFLNLQPLFKIRYFGMSFPFIFLNYKIYLNRFLILSKLRNFEKIC